MNRAMILMIVMAYPAAALAQSRSQGSGAPYQPAVPVATNVNEYGGWGGNSGGGTVAGSAMNGMANVISSKGNYNLSTSAAAINMTQAQRNEIQNRQLYTDTYFDMRATNKRARTAEAGPRPTMEQLAQFARAGAPRRISPSQVDPVSGRINWPSTLQMPNFDSHRGQLDQLVAQWVKYGGLAYADQMKVRQITDSMFEEMKSQIQEIPPQDYVACRSFLQSLSYAVTKTELE